MSSSPTTLDRLCSPESNFIVALAGPTAALSLVAGIYSGLMRIGLSIPGPGWLMRFHGPLMLFGFLGVLIPLERFVAIRSRLSQLAVLAVSAGIWVGVFGPLFWGQCLIVIGSFLYFATLFELSVRHPQLHHWIMAAGALSLFGAATLWMSSHPMPRIVPWWASFLLWTIAGERLELSRVGGLAGFARVSLALTLLSALGALGIQFLWVDIGFQLFGAGLAIVAAWLWKNDITGQTARTSGLPGYMAKTLRGGYVWLGLCGLGLVTHGQPISAFSYDAIWHSFFFGFVFSMIFAHAPVIFPALTGIRIDFHRALYAGPAVLHLGLSARVGADFFHLPMVRRAGGVANALAIALFAIIIARQIRPFASNPPTNSRTGSPSSDRST